MTPKYPVEFVGNDFFKLFHILSAVLDLRSRWTTYKALGITNDSQILSNVIVAMGPLYLPALLRAKDAVTAFWTLQFLMSGKVPCALSPTSRFSACSVLPRVHPANVKTLSAASFSVLTILHFLVLYVIPCFAAHEVVVFSSHRMTSFIVNWTLTLSENIVRSQSWADEDCPRIGMVSGFAFFEFYLSNWQAEVSIQILKSV